MDSSPIKRVFIIVSVVLTLTMFGLVDPLCGCVASEASREQMASVSEPSEEVVAEDVQGAVTSVSYVGSSIVHASSDSTPVSHHHKAKHHETIIGKWDNVAQTLMSKDMWQLIVGGLQTTVIIFIFAAIAAILLGAMLAYLAISHKWPWLYKPLNWFVTIVHDIPSVALMMFFYYVIFAGEMNGVLVSIISLGVYTSGSLAKIFKIHIMQVGNGQIEAGRALGLTTRQCYRYVVLPQAVKTMLPLVIAELKLQLRATSYAGYIAQKDLIKAVFAVGDQCGDMLLPLLIASILYLMLSWMIARVIKSWSVKFFKYD